MSKRTTNYSDEFKKQIVELIMNGKQYKEVVLEYDIARSTLSKWVNNYSRTGSFIAKENRSEHENELIRIKKELAYLKMENDILKQAALILGRR